MKVYRAIGLMSGTSLDGLDIACCRFENSNGKWKFQTEESQTFQYDPSWKKRLAGLVNATAIEIMLAHVELGKLFGSLTRHFIERSQFKADLIASHGHTVFHQPNKGFSLQIGSGYEILTACQTQVVCDFRSLDVALGGQGAPLVPIGDKLLFSEYDFCLNLGGISNISFDTLGERKAFDIAPHNIVLNRLSNYLGKDFDRGGIIASQGNFNKGLFKMLNEMDYYKKSFPKSLGIEYIEQAVFPLLNSCNIPIEDKLHTFNHHVAFQIDKEIRKAIGNKSAGRLLVTGGGAYNEFFLNLLRQFSGDTYSVEVPDKKIIDFKEAIIFAFLGVLRVRKEINTLKSVTGASRDSCGGVVLE